MAVSRLKAPWSVEIVDSFLDSLPRPQSLKEAMRFRYPQVPTDIKLRGVFGDDPPLNSLCPSGGYTRNEWKPDVASWFEQLPDVPCNFSVTEGLQIAAINILGNMAHLFKGDAEYFRYYRCGGIPRPEGCFVSKETGMPIMFCLVDFYPDLSCVLDRLVNYMQVTGARYGLVTCMSSTWMCKRDESSSGEVLSVSEPLENPLMGIGFLIEQARNDPRRLPIVTRPVATFDYGYGLELIRSGLGKTSDNVDKIVGGAMTGDAFKIEDLTDTERIPLACENRYFSVVAIRGKYKGQQVVVKIRDLTSPYFAGFNLALLNMAVEVDKYMTLRKLQGHGIPRLLSWGFMKGCMFSFVMLSDEGRSRMEDIAKQDLGNPRRKLVLPKAFEILDEMHKRGLVYKDMNITNIVTKQDANGGFSLSLAGLTGLRLKQVMSHEWFELVSQNKTKLKVLIELISNDRFHCSCHLNPV